MLIRAYDLRNAVPLYHRGMDCVTRLDPLMAVLIIHLDSQFNISLSDG